MYQVGGLAACLWTSTACALTTGLLSLSLPAAAGAAPLLSAVEASGGD
jgi:hypothetical protein